MSYTYIGTDPKGREWTQETCLDLRDGWIYADVTGYVGPEEDCVNKIEKEKS